MSAWTPSPTGGSPGFAFGVARLHGDSTSAGMSGELGFAGRETEGEGGAAARRGSDGHGAAVSLHHAFDDVEAETGAAGVPPAPAPELREHPIGLLLRDANTFVADRDGDTVVPRLDDDLDASGAVPYRVLEQFPGDLVDFVRVHP